VALAEGKGLRVRDLDGREYLELLRRHPHRVGRPLQSRGERRGQGADRPARHVSTLYPTLPIVELAEKLVAIAPGKLDKAYFTASGTEADETRSRSPRCTPAAPR